MEFDYVYTFTDESCRDPQPAVPLEVLYDAATRTFTFDKCSSTGSVTNGMADCECDLSQFEKEI
jgi:hypothetical protein